MQVVKQVDSPGESVEPGAVTQRSKQFSFIFYPQRLVCFYMMGEGGRERRTLMRVRVLATAASAWTCWIRAFLSSVEEGSEEEEVDEGEEPKKDILSVFVCELKVFEVDGEVSVSLSCFLIAG